VPCRVSQRSVELTFALDGRRGQYYSSAILQELERAADSDSRVLGVTSCDLYVPVLTFVFGEAQLDGNCAVVSTARLAEPFTACRAATTCCASACSKKPSTS